MPIKSEAADERPTWVATHRLPTGKPVIPENKITATPFYTSHFSPFTLMARHKNAECVEVENRSCARWSTFASLSCTIYSSRKN